MGKILSIIAACAVVAGGAAFGLFTYSDLSHRQCAQTDISACPIASDGGCCSESAACESDAAMAVAGPAALLGLSPVNAQVSACCARPAAAKLSCCSDEAATPTSLVAVTGTAATAAK